MKRNLFLTEKHIAGGAFIIMLALLFCFTQSPEIFAAVKMDPYLLNKVQSNAFNYCYYGAHPDSGMLYDHYLFNVPWTTSGVVSGGTGMGIMAIIVGIDRGFISRADGAARILKIVTFLSNKATRYHGAWVHFMDGTTGAPINGSIKDGADIVETSFVAQGLITAAQYFNKMNPTENQIRIIANNLWHGIDWHFFTNDLGEGLYWLWSPTDQFSKSWTFQGFTDGWLSYILGMASPTFTISNNSYRAWIGQWNNYTTTGVYFGIPQYIQAYGNGVNNMPLFYTHFSSLGLDPRSLNDGRIPAGLTYCDVFRNITLINRAYCIADPNGRQVYGENNWGLTSCMDATGHYLPLCPYSDDGTIAPTAALSAMPYTPDESYGAMLNFYHDYSSFLWGMYGFYDSFNLTVGGTMGGHYVAIDEAPIVVMIENHRTQLLWKLFMSHPDIQSLLTKLTNRSSANINEWYGWTITPKVYPVIDPTSPDLSGYWNFNDNLNDASTNWNHGTMADPVSFSNGINGKSLYFNGINNFVDCGNTQSLDITGDITIGAWIKTTQNNYGVICARYRGSSPYQGYGFQVIPGGQLAFWFGASDGHLSYSTGIVNDGKWHHVAVSGSGSSGTFYIDGQSSGTFAYSPIPWDPVLSDHFQIGSWQNASYFLGKMDDVAIWKRGLSVTEIQNQYQKYRMNSWNLIGAPGFTPNKCVMPSLAQGPNGVLYIVYSEVLSRSIAIPHVMKFDGSTWTMIGALPSYTQGYAAYPVLAIDPNGVPYIAYGNGSQSVVKKYNGTDWVNVGTPGFAGGAVFMPSLAVDLNGTPYIAYGDVANNYKATVMKFNGTAWFAVGTPGFSTYACRSPSLSISSSGTPYLAYVYDNGWGTGLPVAGTVMKYDGTTWVDVGTPGSAVGAYDYISLILDPRDTPYIAYKDSLNGYQANVKKYNGTTWESIGSPGSPNPNGRLSLALDSGGTPYVAYGDSLNGSKATIKKYNGYIWLPVENPAFPLDSSVMFIPMIIELSGTPVIVYPDDLYSSKATCRWFK